MKKIHKEHLHWIRGFLRRHRLKGMVSVEHHIPDGLEKYVHERITTARQITKYHCKKHKGLRYDMCEAKVFVETNPDVVEGLVFGRWESFMDSIG